MAPSLRLSGFVFLLALVASLQVGARKSQFFSKVSTSNTDINNNGNGKETTTFSIKGDESLNKQQQESTFVRDAQDGYGLYADPNSPEMTTTTTKLVDNSPYTSATTTPPTTSTYKSKTNNNNFLPYSNQNKENYATYPNADANTNTNKYYYNNDQYSNNNGYEEQQQQQTYGETSLQEATYPTTTTTTTSNNNYNTNYEGSAYNNNVNVVKQGMSDTRFLENGKYYYDTNNDNTYNNYQNNYQKNSRSSTTSLANSYYNNNANANANYQYDNIINSSMDKYSNQQEVSEDTQNEQYVP